MEHNIIMPCFIHVGSGPELLEKVVKVFSDFGVSSLRDDVRAPNVELLILNGRATFNWCCMYYLEEDSKEIFEKDLDEYLAMKEPKINIVGVHGSRQMRHVPSGSRSTSSRVLASLHAISRQNACRVIFMKVMGSCLESLKLNCQRLGAFGARTPQRVMH